MTPPTISRGKHSQPQPQTERPSHALIIAADESRYLDTVQLNRLEQAFRQWAEDTPRSDVKLSRKRILLIFLLIRYTGAKLNEVLALDPRQDFDYQRHLVVFGKGEDASGRPPREVQIPESLSEEFQAALADFGFKESRNNLFKVDPGHVRRKFYERAAACGFAKELGGPDALRKARAVELLQNNLPLPVVQRILGHSSPNLTASFVSFSEDEIQRVTRFFLEKESRRQTSARNAFFGKISAIQKGDLQTKVEMVTLAGDRVTTVITNDSLARLGLKIGRLITAEVKAPWVVLHKGELKPECSAENAFQGTVGRIIRGKVTTECLVQLADGTELCSVITSDTGRRLDLHEKEPVWALFNSFAVVLHLD
uniref:Transporter n=1 Tax=Desulfobacca acetoxidans TaxID=60893 RepID=A0A7C3YZP0_9BACT